MPKMTTSKDAIKAPEALPEGEYVVKLTGFKPKKSKAGDSVNYYPQLEVEGHVNKLGKPINIMWTMNSKGQWAITDFLHGFGLHWEDVGNGQLDFPGVFNGPEDKPENWQYQGPLLGRKAKVYLTVNGQYNEIKYFVCAVPGCNTKYPDISHSKELNKKK